jgi:ATP-dependent Clp protease adaptor protein ClpS
LGPERCFGPFAFAADGAVRRTRCHTKGEVNRQKTESLPPSGQVGLGWQGKPDIPAGMRDQGDNSDGKDGSGGIGTGIVTKTRPKTKKPSLYKVLLLNDDYTPMEFVVHILEKIFGKTREEAVDVMLHVHRHGVGICGVFTFEVAETKVAQVIEFARRHQHPLQCTMEKE